MYVFVFNYPLSFVKICPVSLTGINPRVRRVGTTDIADGNTGGSVGTSGLLRSFAFLFLDKGGGGVVTSQDTCPSDPWLLRPCRPMLH